MSSFLERKKFEGVLCYLSHGQCATSCKSCLQYPSHLAFLSSSMQLNLVLIHFREALLNSFLYFHLAFEISQNFFQPFCQQGSMRLNQRTEDEWRHSYILMKDQTVDFSIPRFTSKFPTVLTMYNYTSYILLIVCCSLCHFLVFSFRK